MAVDKKEWRYKIAKYEGEHVYISQLNGAGMVEAIFKGYPNYRTGIFTLYPETLIIKGIDGFTKKVVNFEDVLPLSADIQSHACV